MEHRYKGNTYVEMVKKAKWVIFILPKTKIKIKISKRECDAIRFKVIIRDTVNNNEKHLLCVLLEF